MISHLDNFTAKFKPPGQCEEEVKETWEWLQEEITEEKVTENYNNLTKLSPEALQEKAMDIECLALKLDHEQAEEIERGRRLGLILE